MDLAESDLQSLYLWVDEVPLSRPKKNIARDFSDGVLMAEILYHYYPKLVELHNFGSTNTTEQKRYNWETLNQKVLKKLGFQIQKPDIEACCSCKPGAVERVLRLVQYKISAKGGGNRPPAGTEKGRGMEMTEQSQAREPLQDRTQQQEQQQQHPQIRAIEGMMAAVAVKPKASTGSSEADQREIAELKETNVILESKVRKLEQLVRLKDAKIQTLQAKITGAGLEL